MKKFVLLAASAALLLADAYAFNVKLLANNKETISRELSRDDVKDAEAWARSHRLSEQLKPFALKALSDSFNELEKIDTTCDLGLIKRVQQDALKYRLINDKGETASFIAYLRQQDMIDDILFKLLKLTLEVSLDMDASLTESVPGRPFNVNTRQNAGTDLEKFYSNVKQWPDDVSRCSLDIYADLVGQLTFKNGKDRDNQMMKLNWLAVKDGAIDLATYNRLEVLRRHDVFNWNVYFKRYADVINNAKDKMAKKIEEKATNDFAVEYVSRRDGVTQRTNLFRTYSSTQIVMLSQIMERTAKRIDAHQASLNWQFSTNPEDREIYVLSPMEQYRAAIRMLRKEMAQTMRSTAFAGINLEYEHLIAAAYETGFIKSEELDQILKFEDFWNPKTPKWKAYANFAFSIAGTASFYLPPPWNIIGAIGLVLTQSKIANDGKNPDPDDNWNVIL